MASCLIGAKPLSEVLNQCCNIVDWNFGDKFQWNLNLSKTNCTQENEFENVVCIMADILSWPQCINFFSQSGHMCLHVHVTHIFVSTGSKEEMAAGGQVGFRVSGPLNSLLPMVTEIWVNIGSGNGLLPDGTKPLPEPMFISEVQRHSPGRNFMRDVPTIINRWNDLESNLTKTLLKSPMDQWVNSLRPSDTIWRHRSGSTLSQVMACCLTAPSHYLNQCWLISTV